MINGATQPCMPNMAPDDDLQALLRRFTAMLDRLGQLEEAAGVTAADTLAHRQQAILNRLCKLEQACGVAPAPPGTAGGAPAQPKPVLKVATAADSKQPAPATVKPEEHPSVADPAASPTQKRLALELIERGIVDHRFVRCPPEYYSQPLEFRRGCLTAPSVYHLCKTIIMENTRAHPSVTDWSDPHNSKYYMVIVQYAARLNAEKLKSFIQKMNRGKFGSKYFKMRLAPEAVSDELSGFSHNAVSPIGIKARLPIIMSHKIAKLQPDFFFLGAGEVDLKVGFSAAEFIAAYKPFVVDCTYEEGEGGSDEDDAAGGQD